MAERDFQAELKAAQASVKALGTKRERLVGDARLEEDRVKTATEQLVSLGVENAAKLTVDELKALSIKTQAEMEANLDLLKTQILAGEALMVEYESVTQ